MWIYLLMTTGAKVSDTVRTGIVNVMTYENQTQLYLAGNVAALSGKGTYSAKFNLL